MDNLTHTVIGYVAGAAAAHVVTRLRRGRIAGLAPATRHVAFAALGMIGGNLPDSDLLVSYGDGDLGYLLQHRGYTHTLLGCLALALLLFAGALATLRARRHVPDAADLRGLGCMALVAVFLHLGMDALNSYGVHPFWPFDNTWLYGDTVFIIEPWYWIAAAPLLLVIRPLAGRIALGVLLAGALSASFVLQRGAPGWPLALALLIGALVYAGRRVAPRHAVWACAAAMACVTGAFALGGQLAAREVGRLARSEFPGEAFIDHVLEPSPTNPLCWHFLLLQHDRATYVVRYGVLALGPQPRPESCPRVFQRLRGTAPWQAPSARNTPRLHWLGELALPLERLPALLDGRCDAAALMQFVRAPYAVERDGHWIVGDLRFDREPGLGLAELDLAAPPRCPRAAPWLPPRAGLLQLGASMGRAGESR